MVLKVKRFLKAVFLTGLILVLLISAEMSAFAFTEKDALPEVTRWVNGAALSSEGIYLSDTWAIDSTDVSEHKYVLINQESTEQMRVANYPDDISAGSFVNSTVFDISFELSIPKDIKNDVIVTLSNDSAEYNVTFNESEAFLRTLKLYPGDYQVTTVEVSGSEDKYSINEDFSLNVNSNKTVSLSLLKDTTDVQEKTNDDSMLGIVKAIDSNGDLLWDTIKLIIAIGILFIAYSLIQRKRKKAEEINQ